MVLIMTVQGRLGRRIRGTGEKNPGVWEQGLGRRVLEEWPRGSGEQGPGRRIWESWEKGPRIWGDGSRGPGKGDGDLF